MCIRDSSKITSQFGLQSATRLHEAGIASNRGSECRGEYAVSYTHLTRISGENFGSGITFGTVGAASAPGQFPIGELRSLLDALHEKNEEDELKQ